MSGRKSSPWRLSRHHEESDHFKPVLTFAEVPFRPELISLARDDNKETEGLSLAYLKGKCLAGPHGTSHALIN
jgi:hypothetical protein